MKMECPIDLMPYTALPGAHVWIGKYSPLDWQCLDLAQGTNFRASSVHHQQYDVVWGFEESFNLDNMTRMELLLDEMIRLLKSSGTLLLRYASGLVPAIKRFLARRPSCTVEVLEEWWRQGEIISVLRIQRHHLEKYQDQRWSFAVLTTGTKEAEVVKFIRSIRDLPEGPGQEIIICGPRSAAYDPYGVTYLDRVYRSDLAEIAQKKNDIAAMARHPNLLITHDRYALNPDFFEGFARFGYDFDFVTLRQWFDTGEEYPSYCSLQYAGLWISRVRMLHKYDGLYDGHFINGGLFAIKTHTFREVPLNPILFWEQGEDVEFTQMLRDHSFPPRINCFSSAETVVNGPRGQITREVYRIGKEPWPDHIKEYPPDAVIETPPPPSMVVEVPPEPAPVEPEIIVEPPPPEPEPEPIIELPVEVPRRSSPVRGMLRLSARVTEKVLGKLVGSSRAARLVGKCRQKKFLALAWGLMLMLNLISCLLLLLIAIRTAK